MSLRSDIEERAVSLAKAFDHGELLQEHVLLAILKRSTNPINQELESLAIEQVTDRLQKLRSIKHSDSAIKISAEAKDLLNRCSSLDSALECEQELLHSLFEIDLKAAIEFRKPEISGSGTPSKSIPTLEEALADLDSLVGLNQVKADVRKLIAVHQANQVRQENGLMPVPQSLHLVFTGSPGTGKTTVARCIANIYRAIGLLPDNGLVEVGRADLVAGYVGQTALKVKEVIDSARGGVLFIDEAYALSNDSGHGFGDEAIAELVKGMENYRHELAVIAAGYKEDMNLFVSSNPGLKSRFQNFVNFPDYSANELIQIFSNLATANQVGVSDELNAHLKDYFAANTPKGELGNARFVRNLFESMFKNMAARAAEDGVIEVSEITKLNVNDIPEFDVIATSRGIGFLN